jgi:dTDP-4-amino-4,6-dideoxygalactose transaminase
MIKNIPWSRPDIGQEERDAVQRVMESGWVTIGPETKRFEDEIRIYLGCKHAVVVGSGSSALLMALAAHDPEIVTIPSYAYHSTSDAAKLLGIEITYGPIEQKTIQLMPLQTFGCALPISFAGLPLDAVEWTGKNLIEDAAESFGAESRGVKTGAQGWTAIFSFHAAKTITMVEGGAVVTDNDAIYEKLTDLRRTKFNFKPTDMSSAIGRVQLAKVGQYLRTRRNVSKIYHEKLENAAVGFQSTPRHVTSHANMMFPIFVDNPAKVATSLKEMGIETRLGWVPPWRTAESIWVSEHILTLPIFNTMSIEEAEYVAECVKKSL